MRRQPEAEIAQEKRAVPAARPKFREETPLETYDRAAADVAAHVALHNLSLDPWIGKEKSYHFDVARILFP